MEKVQTIKFSSNASNLTCHNVDELNVGSGSLNLNAQPNSFSISNSEIVIKVDPTTHTSGSSAVVTRNITNYPWDLVYIPGNLVAVHSSGNFIAYAIIAPSSPNGIVRIISRRTGVRGLIKNIPGLIKDLAFAYLSNRVLLAFTDQYGTLFVYEVFEEEKTLRTHLLVEVKRNEDEEASDFQRVIWCPFIPDEPGEEEPEEGEEENFAYLLVVSNGPLAEIWHIMTLTQTHGTGPIAHSQVKPGSGHQVMEKHSAPISDAAFSPDGTALATASLDGYVKFFQVYMADNQNSPRCLHQWNPHDGKPLSCLFFLDNHKNPSPDVQFWKYAVTGACNNTEIKTWSCETWQCNQVVKVQMADRDHDHDQSLEPTNLSLKAAIDPSSKYLVLSDIYRRVLYVLILCQEPANSSISPERSLSRANGGESVDSTNGTPTATGKIGVAKIVSISELPIQYPAIFLCITGAEWKPYKRWKHELGHDGFHEDHCEDMDEDRNDMDIVEGLVLKSVLINTKSLQDATIRFQPALPLAPHFDQLRSAAGDATHNHNDISVSQDSIVIKDGLTDLSMNLSSTLTDLENQANQKPGPGTTSNHTSRPTPVEVMDAMDNNNLLVSFPCKPGSNTIIGSDGSPILNVASSPGTIGAISAISEARSGSSLTSPALAASATSPVDCSVSSQPVTMNLLTPESFSSPGRADDDDVIKKEVEITRGPSTEGGQREAFIKQSPSPEAMKSAALALLLRVNSGSRLQPSSETSPSSLAPQNSNDRMDNRHSKSILETVVAGSSRSPVANMLPPPPRTGPSPLPTKEEGPLATSEVSATSPHPCSEGSSMLTNSTISGSATTIPHVGSGIGLASSTSSPSLEVQQILHSHNIKQEHFDEDDDRMETSAIVELPNSQSDKSFSKASKCLIDLSKTPPASLLSLKQPHHLTSTQSQPVLSPNLTNTAISQISQCAASQMSHMSPMSLSSNNSSGSKNTMYPCGIKSTGMTSASGLRHSLEHANGSEDKRFSPTQCQSLQEFINITAASKMEQKPKQTGKSALLDMFEGLKIMQPPATSQLSHLIEPGSKQIMPLCDTSLANASMMSEGIPVSSTGAYGTIDSNNTLPLMRPLSSSKLHITCEELEAEIKCSSPTTLKKPVKTEPGTPVTPTATPLSNLGFAQPLHSSLNQGAAQGKAENGVNAMAQLENSRYEKTLEEISSLRELILSCNSHQEEKAMLALENTRKLTNQLDKSIKNLHQINKALDDLRKSQNKFQDQIPHLISTSAKSVIENCVRQEIRNSLTPALNKCMEPTRAQLHSEIRTLVSTSEVHISESLTKAACSRTFIDNLSTSVASALSVSVQSACREAYNKVVVPGFNAITQQVFAQLNDAFTRGTKEYMQHVENESQTTRNALLENVSTNSRTLETTSATLSTHVTVLMDALHKNLSQQTTLSETLSERLRHIIHDEISRAMQEHQAAVEARSSRAQTPASPTPHQPANPKVARQQMQQLISQGQFNLAFKQALSASDLSLVVFVCERINPQQLFSQTPSPLSQDVLLSLVNQLSHDLTTFTDLKTKYLEEAVMNLDTTHPVTREHMRKVLQEFQRSLSSHIEVNPNHKKLKMLLLAVNHLVAA